MISQFVMPAQAGTQQAARLQVSRTRFRLLGVLGSRLRGNDAVQAVGAKLIPAL